MTGANCRQRRPLGNIRCIRQICSNIEHEFFGHWVTRWARRWMFRVGHRQRVTTELVLEPGNISPQLDRSERED